MGLKFYVAARFNRKEDVRKIRQRLESLGHELSFDWTGSEVDIPYKDNEKKATLEAVKDINGVKNCDVFVLLTGNDENDTGKGLFVGLGAGIISNLLMKRPMIYVIEPMNTKSVFFYHASVIRLHCFEEVLRDVHRRFYFLCDGCNVNFPWEHRCHGDQAMAYGQQTDKPCECPECAQ